LSNFHKIFRRCTTFQVALGVKISLDMLNGLWSYGCFKLAGSGYPQILSAPSRRNYVSDPISFKDPRTCSMTFITMPRLVGLGFKPPPRRPKTWPGSEGRLIPLWTNAYLIALEMTGS